MRSSDSFFAGGSVPLKPKKTADKFAGSLFFWVGLTLQNTKKTAGKSEFQFFLDKPVLQNPAKPQGKTAIREFFRSPKDCGTPREDPNFEPCSLRENREEFLDEPVLQNPKTLRENPHFENFLGPLKIAGNRGKIKILKPVHCGKTAKKIRISKPVPKISQLANPPILLLFLLTSASK